MSPMIRDMNDHERVTLDELNDLLTRLNVLAGRLGAFRATRDLISRKGKEVLPPQHTEPGQKDKNPSACAEKRPGNSNPAPIFGASTCRR